MFLLSSFDGLRWYLGNDCVRASVAHDFYIDFSGKHMSTKSYQKYGRNGRTDAFLGLDKVSASLVLIEREKKMVGDLVIGEKGAFSDCAQESFTLSQQPRIITDFAPTLQLFLEEEFIGDALFDALANFHEGRARQAFQLMAEIERGVIATMGPAIARHGLKLADPEGLREDGRCEAEAMRDMSWSDFLSHVDEDYPAFVDELEQLFRLAPKADKADIQLFLDHEVALIDFAAAEQNGDPKSVDILTAFLQRVT